MSFYDIHAELVYFINELAKARPAEAPKAGAVPSEGAKGKRSSSPEGAKRALLEKIDSLLGAAKVTSEQREKLVAEIEGLGRLPEEELTENQKLLTYCRCAHIFENNGDPIEHAGKLAQLFDTAAGVFNALGSYAKQTRSGGGRNHEGQFVHDANSV